MLNKTSLERILIAWMSLSLITQVILYISKIEYDSGGVKGFLWWIFQFILLPITLASEILGTMGLNFSGVFGYIILTFLVGIFLYFALRFSFRKRD